MPTRLPLLPVILIVLLGAVAAPAQSTADDNIILGASFESQPLSNGWFIDPAVASKGFAILSVFGRVTGRRSLKLIPNANNSGGVNERPFGLGQAVEPGPYLGKSLYFQSWMKVEGDAVAVMRLLAVHTDGGITWREIRHESPGPAPQRHRDILDVPADDNIAIIVLICSVEGTSGAAYFDDVYVSTTMPNDWPEAMGETSNGYDLSASVFVDAGETLRVIPKTLYGTNIEWIWNGHGIWNENEGRLRPDLIDLGRQMGVGLLRFPGGTFSDFYNWKDGIGPQGARPVTPALPGLYGSLSTHAFGTDELMDFASATDSEAMITVNVSTGTPELAADWVRYVNNGERQVKYWEIGNELYVDNSVFGPSLVSITPQEYVEKYLQYAAAMREADPDIKIGAILDFNYGHTTYRAFPDWADVVLANARQEIDFVSVHNAFAPVLSDYDAGWPARTVYSSMLAAPLLIRDTLQKLSDKIEEYDGRDSDIEVAVSEWGPFFQLDRGSRYIDHIKTLGSALYVASTLKVLLEAPRTDLAAAFKFVEGSAAGWIGLRNNAFTPKAPLFAMEMYTKHFGDRLVKSSTGSPVYESRSVGWVDAVERVPYLDVVTSVGFGNGNLFVMATNKHFDRSVWTTIDVKGFCPTGNIVAWTLSGTALDANTGTELIQVEGANWGEQQGVVPDGRMNLGGPDEVGITREEIQQVQGPPGVITYRFPPRSVTSLEISGYDYACVSDDYGYDDYGNYDYYGDYNTP